MPPISRNVIPLLLVGSLATLAGCGGSGGGSDDDPTGRSEPNPFSVDEYPEYREGDDLSGIWMMVVNAEYGIQTMQGVLPAIESARGTVFIKERRSGSSSYLEVSSPFCTPPELTNTYTSYTGNNVTIITNGVDIDLLVSTYSRMQGTLKSRYSCGNPGDLCLDQQIPADVPVEMVKVAPLPIGNWYDHFEGAAPAIGSIRGVVQSDSTSDAFEFDDDVDCLYHSKGNGGQFFIGSFSTNSPDYESIIVSTKAGETLSFTQSGGVLQYDNFLSRYYGYTAYAFSQQTRNFDMSITGNNPIVLHISADASNDASSDASADGAEIDIEVAF